MANTTRKTQAKDGDRKKPEEDGDRSHIGIDVAMHVVSVHIQWYAFYWPFTLSAAAAVGIAMRYAPEYRCLLLAASVLLLLTAVTSLVWCLTAPGKLRELCASNEPDARKLYAQMIRSAFYLMSICVLGLVVFLLVGTIHIIRI